jgi:hypothetical protein
VKIRHDAISRRARGWAASQASGACNPTHLARNNVVGVQKRTEAEALMKEVEDRGHGRREVRTAANHHKVAWFLAKLVESGRVGSDRVP